jgi:hypothetical protein
MLFFNVWKDWGVDRSLKLPILNAIVYLSNVFIAPAAALVLSIERKKSIRSKVRIFMEFQVKY